MVKVTSPLFSLDAQGSLGSALTYKKRSTTNFVSSQYFKPRICIIAITPIQHSWQHTLSTWHRLRWQLQQQWDLYAWSKDQRWSGFNAFTQIYQRALILGEVPSIWPPAF